MVYVLDINGNPLMPTTRHGKVRRLLKDGKAKVVKRTPFTIQLLYSSTTYTENLTLGVDAGSKTIGLSVSSKTKEYFSAKVTLRSDITKLLATRRECRRTRRNYKTRYRQPRFNNRVKSKHKGWLTPTIENKINTHLAMVDKVCKILPISEIVVETASFDIQKIKAIQENKSLPEGTDYQQGDQLGFWNVREYVLFRDNHTCQCCKGKSKDKILNVHHIESRKTGGDAPDNLITLCETCHKGYHNGTVKLPKTIKRGMSFRDATFMGIMRWAFYNRLKEKYPNVRMTYGYITKSTRIENNLPKDHNIDALCIANHPKAELSNEVFLYKKVRCYNRQIHKSNLLKGGIRKNNQAPSEVKGFRLNDKVKLLDGTEGFVHGRRSSGYFVIKNIDNKTIHNSYKWSNLEFLEHSNSLLVERRIAVPPTI